MTLAAAQALVEYVLIVGHQAAVFLGAAARKTADFVSTPGGLATASAVVIFLALSLAWRRPPRM